MVTSRSFCFYLSPYVQWLIVVASQILSPTPRVCASSWNYNRSMFRLNLAVWKLLAVMCAAAYAAYAQPINAGLQSAVARAMQGQHGTAVVVDVASGKVIASSHLEIAARRVAAPGSSIKPF